jgi:hypothetical protein
VTAYTVAAGDVGKYEIAVTAATEDTVTFGADVTAVEVKQLAGTKPVYFCFGSTAATVKGGHCHDCPPDDRVIVQPPTSGGTVVRLICEATAVVSVSNRG